MPFCIDCGTEISEEELRLYSGRCRTCHELKSGDDKDQTIYPEYYPRELKYLEEHENIPQESFKATEVPSIEEIKRFPKPKGRTKPASSGKGTTVMIIFAIWMVVTFLLALVINLAFWGAFTSHYGKTYWETLFSDGLWSLLVGGIGAIIIMVLFNEMG
ncbi:MAG: hypothetical protein ACFFEN_14085 [Candidatus Thorarchaeota archaeon]